MKDIRQRFFVEKSPIRGDIVCIEDAFNEVLIKQDYPTALKKLLGEMLVSASLLASTIKINGRLSIQIQVNDDNAPIQWAMAECSHNGEIRALAKYNPSEHWHPLTTANDLLQALDSKEHKSVLFINIEPEQGQRYQGIVERVSNNLAECISHYQEQSAQIPTLLKIVANEGTAAGILVQKLPYNSETDSEVIDDDLWPRMASLTHTLSEQELLELPAQEILYRLYHEENIITPEATNIKFGCTCSYEKCLSALLQVGFTEIQAMYEELPENQDSINMDCHFCGTPYPISKEVAYKLFQ